MIKNNLLKRVFTSLFLLLVVFLIFNFELILIYSLIVLGVLSILEFLQLINKLSLKKVYTYLINFFFIIYIFFFCVMFFLISSFQGLKIILFILLLTCVASDIGGYIFGKIFKGPKLTKISPNKTYAGAAGSIILSISIILSFYYYFFQDISLNLILIGIITSIFCQFGDLFFSFLKRKVKIQDTGNMLPGHGGILDRIDGILLGLPFSLLTLIFLI